MEVLLYFEYDLFVHMDVNILMYFAAQFIKENVSLKS